MKIHLKHDFAGRITNEQRYPAGEYISGALPYQLGEYWVANGLAEVIEPDIPPAYPDNDAPVNIPGTPLELVPEDAPITPPKPAKVVFNKKVRQ